ncbi:hypothetical protein ANOBCDAF_04413 [Pleomorphomonas sp. T1.2MG-36]|nr:hypothetical protein ANOBCDAF_04413 [Pleomorphomonas sp. T1.2MG-36]
MRCVVGDVPAVAVEPVELATFQERRYLDCLSALQSLREKVLRVEMQPHQFTSGLELGLQLKIAAYYNQGFVKKIGSSLPNF